MVKIAKYEKIVYFLSFETKLTDYVFRIIYYIFKNNSISLFIACNLHSAVHSDIMIDAACWRHSIIVNHWLYLSLSLSLSLFFFWFCFCC